MKVALRMLVASTMIWPHAGFATCNTTVNPGEGVSAAVANAPAGSTVCLNSGTHNDLVLNGVAKNPRITVQSTSGRGPNSPLKCAMVPAASPWTTLHDVTISHSDFVENARMAIDGAVHSNILLDGNHTTTITLPRADVNGDRLLRPG
jgi:hypothetical protein